MHVRCVRLYLEMKEASLVVKGHFNRVSVQKVIVYGTEKWTVKRDLMLCRIWRERGEWWSFVCVAWLCRTALYQNSLVKFQPTNTFFYIWYFFTIRPTIRIIIMCLFQLIKALESVGDYQVQLVNFNKYEFVFLFCRLFLKHKWWIQQYGDRSYRLLEAITFKFASMKIILLESVNISRH